LLYLSGNTAVIGIVGVRGIGEVGGVGVTVSVGACVGIDVSVGIGEIADAGGEGETLPKQLVSASIMIQRTEYNL